MKMKDTKALYFEICSRVHPIKGMYTASATEKERLIGKALSQDQEKSLSKLETKAIEKLFKSVEAQLDTEEKLMNWYQTLTKHYSPEVIPDSVYIKLISIATKNKFQRMQELLVTDKQSA